MKNIFNCDQKSFTAMTYIWSMILKNQSKIKDKKIKYEHSFTKNRHEFPIKYEQYSFFKKSLIPNLFMDL